MVKLETSMRLFSFWLVILCALWTLGYLWSIGTVKGRYWFRSKVSDPLLLEKFEIKGGSGATYIGLVTPLIAAGTICLLFVTNAPLSLTRTAWLVKPFRNLRLGGNKLNQFGMGDVNFNALFVFFVVLPTFGYFILNVDRQIIGQDGMSTTEKLHSIANTVGTAGVIALSFFLIPVARHNILLAAMGWSPVHVLRLHILSGYYSFGLILLHGLLYIADIFAFGEGSFLDRIIPDAKCWKWKQSEEEIKSCSAEWDNLTGLIAILFFIALIVSSINWFRRRFYRWFYVCHMTFGSTMLLMAIAHWRTMIVYLAPSVIYYLASTTPALVQAVASRFRGGVKIVKVVRLTDSGGCLEVHFAATLKTNSQLDSEACMFVKLCVPSASLVWHPFTVFKHPDDATTVRFLFRPVGPFTKSLAGRLCESPRPISILDGLYRGGDRINEALSHDTVSIVCGGVAITPFLSMIPCLLAAIKQRKSCSTTKLVLHWSCREKGLAAFVIGNYVSSFKRMNAELAHSTGFEFRIVVYHTAGVRIAEVEADPTTHPVTDGVEVTDYDDADVVTNGSDNPGEISGSDDFAMQDKSAMQADALEETDVKGQAMELYRFMPAIHSKIWLNLPHFMAIGGSLWLGFFIIHYYYNDHNFEVHPIVSRFWSIVVWLLTSVALAVLFELGYLVFQMRFPEIKPETYEVKKFDPEAGTSSFTIDEDPGSTASCEAAVGAFFLEHRRGRPRAEDIFTGLGSSNCPGIFMCGPPGLTDMVKIEARKENSYFGLTRFALYEQPFEM